MIELNLFINQPVYLLAADLLRAFSSIVIDTVKQNGIKEINDCA
jgi:hypothetical protein